MLKCDNPDGLSREFAHSANSKLKCESILANLDNSKQFQLVETATVRRTVKVRDSK